LRHVSGRGCDDTTLELFGTHVSDGVRGAADLERSYGLQILELQVDFGWGVGCIQPDEGRADSGSGYGLARLPD
jgi:hypothetical protein